MGLSKMGGAIDRVVVHSNVDFNAEVGKTFSYRATQITESGVWVAARVDDDN